MLSAFDLTGRSVLVTGASSGIGRQCCLAVAHSGGSVIATGRDPARLRETIDLLGGDKHRFVQADLTIAEEMSYLAKEIGELHGVVHSAGIQQYRVLKYLTPQMIREVMAVNFETPVLLTQALIKNKRIARGASLVFNIQCFKSGASCSCQSHCLGVVRTVCKSQLSFARYGKDGYGRPHVNSGGVRKNGRA